MPSSESKLCPSKCHRQFWWVVIIDLSLSVACGGRDADEPAASGVAGSTRTNTTTHPTGGGGAFGGSTGDSTTSDPWPSQRGGAFQLNSSGGRSVADRASGGVNTTRMLSNGGAVSQGGTNASGGSGATSSSGGMAASEAGGTSAGMTSRSAGGTATARTRSANGAGVTSTTALPTGGAAGTTTRNAGGTNTGGTNTGGSLGRGGSASSAGAGAVSFARIYSEIIEPNCAVCHSTGPGASGGSLHMGDQLGAFSELVGNDLQGVNAKGSACGSTSGLKRVSPGNAQASLLWQKVDAKAHGASPACGNAMPANAGAVLTQPQIDLIARWINEGAKAI